jgi:glycerophosphoryl diester phosphodiesterase
MSTSSVPFCISHRLRGFDHFDATAIGLRNAIAARIPAIEIDLRLTKDKQFIINHDAWPPGSRQLIRNYTLAELRSLFPGLLPFSELLSLAAPSPLSLFIDCKEYGYEEQLLEYISRAGVTPRCTIVSWLPETLLKIHALAPALPLCFSHYPVTSPLAAVLQRNFLAFRHFAQTAAGSIAKAPLFLHHNTYNRLGFAAYSQMDYRGTDHEHFATVPVRGELASALIAVNGSVCIHQQHCTPALVSCHSNLGIQVMLYGIKTKTDLAHALSTGANSFLLDSPELFIP